MSRYRLSKKADADIKQVARDSFNRWGWSQAEKYVSELHETFDKLAQFPALGRNVSYLREGYWRFEHASHLIFYRQVPDGVFVVRVLHEKMLPDLHLGFE